MDGLGKSRLGELGLSLAPDKPTSTASLRQASAHIPALDGIRGAAAAAVFIYHYGGGASSPNPAFHFLGEAIHLGWVGVSLFFVLSGFLITGILLDSLRRPGWWKTFYIRRTLRIFPLYYTALLGGVFVLLLLRTRWSSISPVWPFFFYLQDIPGVVRFYVMTPLLVLGHFWSLAIEEQFYLVWPFLLSLASRRSQVRQLCLVVCVLSLIFRICVFSLHLDWQWAGYFIAGRAGEMAAGGFLAASLRGTDQQRNTIFRAAKPVLAASVIGAMVIIFCTNETGAGDPWFGTLGVAFLSSLFAALIALSLQPGWTQRVFRVPLLRWLGKISYGIYVYHLLLYPVFAWLAGKILPPSAGGTYQLLLGAVATVGTLSVASLSFATLERGFLRLKDSVGKPQPIPALR
jgi:peptidoglycan/LPS O-acetylase OafA/YrhL